MIETKGEWVSGLTVTFPYTVITGVWVGRMHCELINE